MAKQCSHVSALGISTVPLHRITPCHLRLQINCYDRLNNVRTITPEEHYMSPAFAKGPGAGVLRMVESIGLTGVVERITDGGGGRITEMDAAGSTCTLQGGDGLRPHPRRLSQRPVLLAAPGTG